VCIQCSLDEHSSCVGLTRVSVAVDRSCSIEADALSLAKGVNPRKVRAVSLMLARNVKDLISEGHDMIWVIVGRLTKTTHFLPVRGRDSNRRQVEVRGETRRDYRPQSSQVQEDEIRVSQSTSGVKEMCRVYMGK
jgi:hypothetical protein